VDGTGLFCQRARFGRDRLLDRRVLNIVLVVLVINTLSRVV
jgi:hypothetical protein